MTEDRQPNEALVHIADLHFWEIVFNPARLLNKRFLGNLNVALRRRREYIMSRAQDFLEAVAATRRTQALLTGDFSSTATDTELRMGAAFVEQLADSGFDVHVLAGNHDVYTFESVRRRRFDRYFGKWLPEQGYPARLRLQGGAPLILVPTVTPNVFSSKGNISDHQVHQVEALIEGIDGPIIVAGHYPLLHRTRNYRTTPERRLRNAQALRQALGAADQPILYVCGHVHRFSFTHDDQYDNLFHLTTGAFFRHDRKTGIHGEFAEILVRPERFEVIRHTALADRWETVAQTASPP